MSGNGPSFEHVGRRCVVDDISVSLHRMVQWVQTNLSASEEELSLSHKVCVGACVWEAGVGACVWEAGVGACVGGWCGCLCVGG